MPPKENSERACEECIHFFACSKQCGVPMAQGSATGCECYETVKSSMAYYVGTLDGAKGKIPNRLRELAEADKEGRCIILPCKVGDTVWVIAHPWTDELLKKPLVAYANGMKLFSNGLYVNVLFDTRKINGTRDYGISRIGKNAFLTREEAEKAMEG